MSKRHFKALAGSSNPFVCLHCFLWSHSAAVAQLQAGILAPKSEVTELQADLGRSRAFPSSEHCGQEADSALAVEVQQLKPMVSNAEEKWTDVVRHGQPRPRQNQHHTTTKVHSQVKQEETSASGQASKKYTRTSIKGARKIEEYHRYSC